MDARTITPAAPVPDRLWPVLELATAFGLLELELWSLRASGPAWLNVLIYAIIGVAVAHSHWRRERSWFISAKPQISLGRSWLEAVAACLILSTILVMAAALVGDANETFEFVFLDKPPLRLANWLLGKFGAALAQQIALQGFLWPACLEVTRSKPTATVLAASLFGLIHLPSPTLVAITTLAGVVWITLYQRSIRLAPLVLSHMILATLAHGSLPERLTYDMRVGSSAMTDMNRFEQLNDPHVRLINRRLKNNRVKLRKFTSIEYFQAQGNNVPAFVRALFRDIYGRTATETEFKLWTTRPLANPREDLPPFFIGSDEYAQIQQAQRASSQRSVIRR